MKKKLFSRQQRIMISVSSIGLTIAQFRLEFLGWTILHTEKIALPEAEQDFNAIAEKIQELTKAWNVPTGTWVSWILPSDILSVLHGNVANTTEVKKTEEIAPLVPYPLNELQFSDKKTYWIHTDWIQALQQTAQKLGWVVDECYSRAQLFLSLLPKALKKQNRFLLESDGAIQYLHIYASNGAVLRTTKIHADNIPTFIDMVRREMVLLQTDDKAIDAAIYGCNIKIAELRTELGLKQLSDCSTEILLLPLLKSTQTGISIQPTYDALLNRVNAWSLGWAVIGSALVGGMVWHDDQLKVQIEDQRFALRHATTAYQNAKAIRRDTFLMADAVAVKNQFSATTPSFQPLAHIIMVLNPPNTIPARLTYYEKTGKIIRIEFTGGKLNAIESELKKNKHFSDLKINNTTGVWEMQWKDVP